MRLARTWMIAMLIVCVSLAFTQNETPADGSLISLPQPDIMGGMPLMRALAGRSTQRQFADTPLPRKVLANLLWAANGINRKKSGKQTAPSSHQLREIEIYIVTAEGGFMYVPEKHALKRIHSLDMHQAVAEQTYVRNAPVSLIYVADFKKFGPHRDNPEREALKKQISSTHCGFIGQNVYLFCASTGLNCVFHGWMDGGKIHEMLRLDNRKHVLFGQAIGYGKTPN